MLRDKKESKVPVICLEPGSTDVALVVSGIYTIIITLCDSHVL
jgi:hypothetical protein